MERRYASLSYVIICLAASLVFLVQPYVGRLLTPRMGGGAQVWISVMLFFQCSLLAGYWLADVLRRITDYQRQRKIFLCGLGLATLLFFVLARGESMDDAPASTAGVVAVLAKTVGIPFVILSMASPLIQYWYAQSPLGRGRDPYRLYVASNLGSLIGLFAYPFVLSRIMGLRSHRVVFVVGMLVTLALLAAAAWLDRRPSEVSVGQIEPEAGESRSKQSLSPFMWVVIAFVPSSLMLGLTTLIAEAIASVPMVWVGPLAIYLLSMMVGFSGKLKMFHLLIVSFLLFTIVFVTKDDLGARQGDVVLHLATLLIVATLLHRLLYLGRPPKSELTRFYGFVSLGGALGGIFNGLAVPLLFSRAFEYELVLGLGVALLPWLLIRPAGFQGLLRVALAWVVLLGASIYKNARYDEKAALRTRSFFGTYAIVDRPGKAKEFYQGATMHGIELPEGKPRHSGYYSREGPVGDVFTWARARPSKAQTLVAGLGIGGLSAYSGDTASMVFVEIDPLVTQLAKTHFRYLERCGDACSVIHGDARKVIERLDDRSLDLLIIDAYSSGSLPVHLMTVEALEIYLAKLRFDGILALHISNQTLHLRPVVARLVRDLGIKGVSLRNELATDSPYWLERSAWAVMSQDASQLQFFLERGWQPLTDDGRPGWTDDFSDVVSAFRFVE